MALFAAVLLSCGGASTEIVIDTVVNDSGAEGTFTVSGGAVTDGVICPVGDFVNVDIEVRSGDTWWFEDKMTCSDGTGFFLVRTEGEGALPTEPQAGSNTGTWTVIDGGGEYEGFEGHGTYDLTLDPWTEKYVGEFSKG